MPVTTFLMGEIRAVCSQVVAVQPSEYAGMSFEEIEDAVTQLAAELFPGADVDEDDIYNLACRIHDEVSN